MLVCTAETQRDLACMMCNLYRDLLELHTETVHGHEIVFAGQNTVLKQMEDVIAYGADQKLHIIFIEIGMGEVFSVKVILELLGEVL